MADTANYRGRAKLDRVIWSVAPDPMAGGGQLACGLPAAACTPEDMHQTGTSGVVRLTDEQLAITDGEGETEAGARAVPLPPQALEASLDGCRPLGRVMDEHRERVGAGAESARAEPAAVSSQALAPRVRLAAKSAGADGTHTTVSLLVDEVARLAWRPSQKRELRLHGRELLELQPEQCLARCTGSGAVYAGGAAV